MKSILKNYRQSPRKVRLVAKSVVGKSVKDASLILSFMPKRAADPIKKLIDSAAANAKVNSGIAIEDLTVKTIEVNKGITLKRMRPRARGSGFPINKRTSHVVVTLASKVSKEVKIDHRFDVFLALPLEEQEHIRNQFTNSLESPLK